MSWWWMAPAGAVIVAFCGTAGVLRHVAAEVRLLRLSLARLARVVVATDDAAAELRRLGPGSPAR